MFKLKSLEYQAWRGSKCCSEMLEVDYISLSLCHTNKNGSQMISVFMRRNYSHDITAAAVCCWVRSCHMKGKPLWICKRGCGCWTCLERIWWPEWRSELNWIRFHFFLNVSNGQEKAIWIWDFFFFWRIMWHCRLEQWCWKFSLDSQK